MSETRNKNYDGDDNDTKIIMIVNMERLFSLLNCTARQCSPLRRKFMECYIIKPAQSRLMKHLVIGHRLKTLNFSAFHWSPRGNLVSIGQHFVITRVVHLPKRTKTSLITESDQSGPNHQLLLLCTARTARSDSDQAVLAVHSCNSWFVLYSLIVWVNLHVCLLFYKGEQLSSLTARFLGPCSRFEQFSPIKGH